MKDPKTLGRTSKKITPKAPVRPQTARQQLATAKTVADLHNVIDALLTELGR